MPIFNNNPDARQPISYAIDLSALANCGFDDIQHNPSTDVYTFHAYGTYVNATGTWLRRHLLPESSDILMRVLRDRANTPVTLRGPTPRLSDSFAEATVQPRPTMPMTATAVRMNQERVNTAMRAMMESTINPPVVSGTVSNASSTASVNRTPTRAEILENIQEASRILDEANVPARPPRIDLGHTWFDETRSFTSDYWDALIYGQLHRSNQGVSLSPSAAWPMPPAVIRNPVTGEQRGDTITLRDPTPRPIDPAVRAKELGVVEEQTLKALRKLTHLGWRWNGSDWVYKMT